jgi:ATP-dependent DNA helicase PIF1
MKEAACIMKKSGWTRPFSFLNFDITRYQPSKKLSGSQWKARITIERDKLLKSKFKNAPDDSCKKRNPKVPELETGVKLLDSLHFTKYYKAKSKSAQKIIDQTATDFNLNEEQARAFRIVANHATSPDPDQLKMYLGGIGGTGNLE